MSSWGSESEFESAERYLRRRATAVFGLAAVLNIAATALIAVSTGEPTAFRFMFPSVIAVSSLMVVASAISGWRTRAVVRLGLFGIMGGIFGVIALDGGLDGQFTSLLCVVPVAAAFLLGSRDLIVYCLVIVVTLVVFYVFDAPMSHFADPPETNALEALIVMVLICICAGSVLHFLVRSDERRSDQIDAFARESAHAALHDPLTGLKNRKAIGQFFESLRTDIDCFEFILIDLDRFKPLNDRFGHGKGDEALVYFADVLRENALGAEIIGRTGGDEFFLAMPPQRAASIEKIIGKRFRLGDGAVFSASSGSAAFPADGLSTSEVMSKADKALYAAKRSGGARHVKYLVEQERVRSYGSA